MFISASVSTPHAIHDKVDLIGLSDFDNTWIKTNIKKTEQLIIDINHLGNMLPSFLFN